MQDIALLWFDGFVKAIGPQRPQLLLWDGHASHVSYNMVTKARENGIIVLLLPSHTSNWLQPLDR